MTTLTKMIEKLYTQEKSKLTFDEYEEMFWMMYFGIRPCEWDGRTLYVPNEYQDLYNKIKEEDTCAWEIFDDE